MKIFVFCLLSVPAFCFGQAGTISGNAFWHYNDYVGDKPDAGSDVYLFSSDSTKQPQNTQCDVMGNFKFDNLPGGDYLIMVISRNTTDNGENNYLTFSGHRGECKRFIGSDLIDYKADCDSIDILKNLYFSAASQKLSTWHANKQIKDMELKRSRLNVCERRVLASMAERATSFAILPLISLRGNIQKKINFDIVSLPPGQNKTFISDFGITYQ